MHKWKTDMDKDVDDIDCVSGHLGTKAKGWAMRGCGLGAVLRSLLIWSHFGFISSALDWRYISIKTALSPRKAFSICVCQSSLRSVLEKIPHYNLTGAVLLWEGTAAARSWSWGAKKLALKKQVSKSTRLSKRQAGGRAWRAKKLALNKRKVSKSTRLSKNQFTSREPELRPQKVGSEKAGLIIMHLTNKQNKRKIQTNKQGGRAKSWLWKKGSSLERDGLDS